MMRLSFFSGFPFSISLILTRRKSACIVGNVIFISAVILVAGKRNTYEPEEAVYHA